MRNSMKVLAAFVAVFIAGIIIMAANVYLEPTPTPISSEELPRRYEVYNYRAAGGLDAVRISTSLYINERTISVKGDEIRISCYALSENDNTIFIREGNEKNGEWQISSSFVDGRRDLNGEWNSGYIEIGETIFLPSGEEVTLLEFDSEDNPLFSVVE